MEIVLAFFDDPRVRALVALIALDFLLGLAAALRCGEFDWKKVANFYRTNVFPYLIGYLAFYVATKLIIDPTVLGNWANIVGEGAITIAWAAILASLGSSIVTNIKCQRVSARNRRGNLGRGIGTSG